MSNILNPSKIPVDETGVVLSANTRRSEIELINETASDVYLYFDGGADLNDVRGGQSIPLRANSVYSRRTKSPVYGVTEIGQTADVTVVETED